jgi:hypothetical protein
MKSLITHGHQRDFLQYLSFVIMSTQTEEDTYSWKLTASRVQNAVRQPTDIFSTLLLIGPDVTSRAVAQQCGMRFKAIPLPLAFSFGKFCIILHPMFKFGASH